MDAQVMIVSGMDFIGDIQLHWNNYGSKTWSWKFSPDGYKRGVWAWAKDYKPPVTVKADWHGLPSFKGYCMILTNAYYRSSDDAILNPMSIVYEPYAILYSDVWWQQGTFNPLQPNEPWFDSNGRFGGAMSGEGIGFFKEKHTTRTDAITGKKEPTDWPRSGCENFAWYNSTYIPEEKLHDPYDEANFEETHPTYSPGINSSGGKPAPGSRRH